MWTAKIDQTLWLSRLIWVCTGTLWVIMSPKILHVDSEDWSEFVTEQTDLSLCWHSMGCHEPEDSACGQWTLIRLCDWTDWSESVLALYGLSWARRFCMWTTKIDQTLWLSRLIWIYTGTMWVVMSPKILHVDSKDWSEFVTEQTDLNLYWHSVGCHEPEDSACGQQRLIRLCDWENWSESVLALYGLSWARRFFMWTAKIDQTLWLNRLIWVCAGTLWVVMSPKILHVDSKDWSDFVTEQTDLSLCWHSIGCHEPKDSSCGQQRLIRLCDWTDWSESVLALYGLSWARRYCMWTAKIDQTLWLIWMYWHSMACHEPEDSVCGQQTLIRLCCWLCWGLTSQSTIFQSCQDGAIASWVINQYFRGVKCLAQGHNTAAVGLEPRTSRSGVRHSTTEPPRSPSRSDFVTEQTDLSLCWHSVGCHEPEDSACGQQRFIRFCDWSESLLVLCWLSCQPEASACRLRKFIRLCDSAECSESLLCAHFLFVGIQLMYSCLSKISRSVLKNLDTGKICCKSS